MPYFEHHKPNTQPKPIKKIRTMTQSQINRKEDMQENFITMNFNIALRIDVQDFMRDGFEKHALV